MPRLRLTQQPLGDDNMFSESRRKLNAEWGGTTRDRANQGPSGSREDAEARDVGNLPALASEVLADSIEPFGWRQSTVPFDQTGRT